MKSFLCGRLRRLWPLALACAVPLHAGPDAVETVEKAASDWVKARAETSRLQTEWETQKQLLASMVDGYDERATALEAKRDYLRARTAEDRTEVSNLQAGNQASSAGLETAEAQLKELSARLLQLRPSLPPRLSAALDLPYRSLAGPGLGLGERMQLTMTVLNRCTQFNRTITCEEELLTLEKGGTPQLLEVIYWGLGHGYALDRPAGKAWSGSPGPEGWQWQPLAGESGAVARLLSVYQSKAEPTFVEIPAQITHEPAAAAGGQKP